MKTVLFRAICTSVLILASMLPLAAELVYHNDFEGAVGTEWSSTATDMTPVGARRFLGQFSNNAVGLTLANLPSHTDVTVSLDLFIISSWDGNCEVNLHGGHCGPDIWNLDVRGGPSLLHTTFSNIIDMPVGWSQSQAYPGSFPTSDYPAKTGAAESNTLGYMSMIGLYGDSVYTLSFTVPHIEDSVTFDFSAEGLQGIEDESWGLDNVSVSVTPVPEPSGLLVLMCGLGGLGLARRRRH